MRGASLQGSMLRANAEEKTLNVCSLWIFILVLYSVTSHPAPFLPARQSIENVFVRVSAVSPCLRLPSQQDVI